MTRVDFLLITIPILNRPLKQIDLREYRWGNQTWKITRNWQHMIHMTQDEDKQRQHITIYVLDTTLHKQTRIT
jgi:hypothetical protein